MNIKEYKGKSVTFRVSTGFVGAEIIKTFTLEELGILVESYETEEELFKDVESSYDDWMHENITATWDFDL